MPDGAAFALHVESGAIHDYPLLRARRVGAASRDRRARHRAAHGIRLTLGGSLQMTPSSTMASATLVQAARLAPMT